MMSQLTQSENIEIFRRASVCRSIKIGGLREILQRTNCQVASVELIWEIGDLSAQNYLSVDDDMSYLVNRQKAEEIIQRTPENSILTMHDAWHDWYRAEYGKAFHVEELGSLLYHESTFLKKCAGGDSSIIEDLQRKVQDYLWMYCRFIAEKLEIPLTASITNLKEVFTKLIECIPPEHQEKRQEVSSYIPKLIQQFKQIKEVNMFKGILSEQEFKAFIKFLKSIQPEEKEVL